VDAPILVLGSGQRCGSTLVQRLLTSHPGILIWGEHGGHLADFITMQNVLGQWDENVSSHGRRAFAEGGHQSWMANMLPGKEPLDEAARAYLRALFGVPAAELGRPRWGFKEVRFGYREASALKRLFPALVVIHLTRDPTDVLVSLDAWSSEDQSAAWRPEWNAGAIHAWTEVTESFLDAPPEPWILSRRFEDVVAAPETFMAAVAALIESTPDQMDPTTFGRRIHGYGTDRRLRPFAELPHEIRALIDNERVRDLAARAGYDLPPVRSRRLRRRVRSSAPPL
jgi:hypothetical protein